MAITEQTRRCSACGELFDEGASACPRCTRVLAPSHTLWPRALKRWLLYQLVLGYVSALHPRTAQACWEWLLRATMRGRWNDQKLIPWAATAAECYPIAAEQAAAWEAAGAPNLLDFDAPVTPARRSA
jgi:hypothetical protein